MRWYPLKLSFHVRSYAFGARLIPELLGKRGVPEGVVAETWEISDYRETTGTVTNGALAGQTLHALTLTYPDALVGEGWRGPHFPLLAKFLDASHMLPVHLHADDETARRKYGEPNGKTEAWHILWAKPGASILAGVKPHLDERALWQAFKRQDYDAVMPRYAIQAGDTVYVPGGVLHSFGPDTLIFEIQQTSDLAQSVMPTDLYGKPYPVEVWEQNLRETLDELRTHYQPRPNPGLVVEDGAARRVIGCAGPHFALERWTLRAPYREPAHPQRCATVTNLGEPLTLSYAGGVETLGRAESCLLPAAIGEVRFIPQGEAELLVCYVPDLQADIIAPLRQAGHDDAAIAALGEVFGALEQGGAA
jgi:mannose-6-phosphate isomerase